MESAPLCWIRSRVVRYVWIWLMVTVSTVSSGWPGRCHWLVDGFGRGGGSGLLIGIACVIGSAGVFMPVSRCAWMIDVWVSGLGEVAWRYSEPGVL